MLVSLQWLKKFVEVGGEASSLGEKLTMFGLELAGTQVVNEKIEGLCIGKVLTKKKHPDADMLSLTTIVYRGSSGERVEVPVICGAANIDAGQHIVYASVGTKLPGGMVIKKARIRGVESHGMVCSLAELGKEAVSELIWELPAEASIDEAVEKYMGERDIIFDLEIPSNRGDVMSIYGVAREVAGILELPLIQSAQAIREAGELFIAKHESLPRLPARVENETETLRYMLVRMTGVKVEASPRWLCDRLFAHGLRPINNVVDITNLIMLEWGQPLHAFDGEKLGAGAVEVRRARAGERLVCLDGKELVLAPSDLIISNVSNANNEEGVPNVLNVPIALAGVIGGKESGITEGTEELIIEAACFSASVVRETATRLGLSTDASERFIRQVVSSSMTPFALSQAVALMMECTGAKVASAVYDKVTTQLECEPCTVRLSLAHVLQKLGFTGAVGTAAESNASLGKKEVVSLLGRMGFELLEVSGGGGGEEEEEGGLWDVRVPVYRKDIKHEWDLIEEVARVYGYDHLPARMPRAWHSAPAMLDKSEELVCACVRALGYDEVVTYPFIEEAFSDWIDEGAEERLVPRNPVLPQASVLRSSMLFGILKVVRLNREKRQTITGQYFERGHVFRRSEKMASPQELTATGEVMKTVLGIEERQVVGLLRCLPSKEAQWYDDREFLDHYHLLGDYEVLVERLMPGAELQTQARTDKNSGDDRNKNNGDDRNKKREDDAKKNNEVVSINVPNIFVPNIFEPDECGRLLIGKTAIGYWGRVRGKVCEYFDIKASEDLYKHVYYGELDLEAVKTYRRNHTLVQHYQEVSPYPFIMRDVALVVPERTLAGDIMRDLRRSHEMVEAVTIIEIYRGEKLKEAQAVPGSLGEEAWDGSAALKSIIFRVRLRSRHKTLVNAEADKLIDRIVRKLSRRHNFRLR